jgi:integrase/recombinase XerC
MGTDIVVSRPPGALVAPLLLDEDGTRRLFDAWMSGRNKNTRRAYAQTAGDLAGYLTRRFGRELGPEGALQELLRAGHGPANLIALDYRADLLTRCAPGTVALRLSNLRAAVRLARMLAMVTWTLDTPSVRVEKYRETEGPGIAAVQAIAAALKKRKGPRAARDRALLALLYGQGLRRGEVVSLDVAHLDVAASRAHVLGKGRLEREWVALAPPVLEAMRGWLVLRPGPAVGPLFVGWRGARVSGRLTGGGVATLVNRWGIAAAVQARCRPHGLRHTAATALLDAGLPWQEVAAFTRHRDPSTLAHYDDNRRRRGSSAAARLTDLVKL